MRLGYFGGSFDPPHFGHLAIARAAAGGFALEEVLFVPAGRQPLKPQGAIASFADRLAMVEILCRTQTSGTAATIQSADAKTQGADAEIKHTAAEARGCRFTASALDQPQPGNLPNYTVDSLTWLRNHLAPTDALFVLIGADAFLDLRRWREPDRLLSLAEWIVVSRPGLSLQQIDSLALTSVQRQRVHLLDGVSEPASATEIRRQLSLGGDCEGLLPPEVLAYIRAHHLYEIGSEDEGPALG